MKEGNQAELDQKIRQLEVVVRAKNYHSGLISFVHPHVLCETLCYPEKVYSEEELKVELEDSTAARRESFQYNLHG